MMDAPRLLGAESRRACDASEVSAELASWLVEAGRRHRVAGATLDSASAPANDPPWSMTGMPAAGMAVRVPLLALLALAYLQYFYADTLLTILRLPSLVVFVFAGIAPG